MQLDARDGGHLFVYISVLTTFREEGVYYLKGVTWVIE